MKQIHWGVSDLAVLIKAVLAFAIANAKLPITEADYYKLTESLPEKRRAAYSSYRLTKIVSAYFNYCHQNNLKPGTGKPNEVEPPNRIPPEGYVEMEGAIRPDEFFSNGYRDSTVYCCDRDGNLIDSRIITSGLFSYVEEYLDRIIEKAVVKHLTNYIGPVEISKPEEQKIDKPTVELKQVVEPSAPVSIDETAAIESNQYEAFTKNIITKIVPQKVIEETKPVEAVAVQKRRILAIGFNQGQQKNLKSKFGEKVEFNHVEHLSNYMSTLGCYDMVIVSRYNGHKVNEVLTNRYKVPKERIVFVKGGINSLAKHFA